MAEPLGDPGQQRLPLRAEGWRTRVNEKQGALEGVKSMQETTPGIREVHPGLEFIFKGAVIKGSPAGRLLDWERRTRVDYLLSELVDFVA